MLRVYLGVLVSGLVIDDQVHLQLGRDSGFDALEECQEFLMMVASLTFGEYGSRGDIKGSE